MKLIRKISIGQDYKNEAMHYSVGQEVYAVITPSDAYDNGDSLTLPTLTIANSPPSVISINIDNFQTK